MAAAEGPLDDLDGGSFEAPQPNDMQALSYTASEDIWAYENHHPNNQSPAIIQTNSAPQPIPFQPGLQSRDFNGDFEFAFQSPHRMFFSSLTDTNTNSAQNHYATPSAKNPPFGIDDADFMNICHQIRNDTTNIHAERLQIAPNTCQQCQKQFPKKYKLDGHATRDKHKAYSCLCGELFSRWDVLSRHINSFHPLKTYPCQYCTKCKAFSREDHLTQHLRSFHNFEIPDRYDDDSQTSYNARRGKKYITCPHQGCSYHEGDVFNTRREFNHHLREIHDDCLFPCKVSGCPMIGGKGFFRTGDLLKHEKARHHN